MFTVLLVGAVLGAFATGFVAGVYVLARWG